MTTLIPLLVNASVAAKLCGISLSLWYSLNASGQTPQPIKLNSKNLWSYGHLELWSDAGCPSRASAVWKEILKGQNA